MKYNPYASLLKKLTLGLCLIVFGLTSYLSDKDVTVDSLRKQGEILSSQIESSGRYAVQVTHISGLEAELKEKNYSTLFYTITYQDENGKKGSIGLHGDSDSYDLIDELEEIENLEDNPKWMIAYVTSSSKINNYAEVMGPKLSYDDQASAQLDYYISFESPEKIRETSLTGLILVSCLGLPFILSGLLSYLSSKKNLREFYNLYPELNASLENLQNFGGFIEPDIRLFIYKDHLVSYKSTFKISNLTEARNIYHYRYSFHFSLFPIIRKNQLRVVNTKGKEDRLPMRKARASKADPALTRLKTYISQKFPYIQF